MSCYKYFGISVVQTEFIISDIIEVFITRSATCSVRTALYSFSPCTVYSPNSVALLIRYKLAAQARQAPWGMPMNHGL